MAVARQEIGTGRGPVSASSASSPGELGLAELSMGMSDDFEIAVEEGATTVRLGRILFGPRPGAAPARR